MRAPDSERPRRISPTKNGLPFVSSAISPASSPAILLELVPGDSRHDLRHLVGTEAVQGDPLHALDRPQVREHRAERVVLAEIGVAVCLR